MTQKALDRFWASSLPNLIILASGIVFALGMTNAFIVLRFSLLIDGQPLFIQFWLLLAVLLVGSLGCTVLPVMAYVNERGM